MGSDVELTIYDRQNRKINLVKIVLDPVRFDQGRLQIDIREDGDKFNNREDKIIDSADFAVSSRKSCFSDGGLSCCVIVRC